MLEKYLAVHNAHESRSKINHPKSINIRDQLCWIICISFISFHYPKDEFVYTQEKKT